MEEMAEEHSEFDVPPPHPGLRRLGPLVGTWHKEAMTEDSVIGPGVAVRSDGDGVARAVGMNPMEGCSGRESAARNGSA
jgi:hypothetical protein